VSCEYPKYGYPIVDPPPALPAREIVPEGAFFFPHMRPLELPDGMRRAFHAPLAFIRTDSIPEVVYRNGVRVETSAYTLGSDRPDGVLNLVTFQKAPLSGDLLVLDAYVMRH